MLKTTSHKPEPLRICEECKREFPRRVLPNGKLERIDQYRGKKTCSEECLSVRRSRVATTMTHDPDSQFAKQSPPPPPLSERDRNLYLYWRDYERAVAQRRRAVAT